MRVGVIGAGATGGFLAARLAAAGAPVTVLARGASLTRVRDAGIELTNPDGTRIVGRPDTVVEHAADAPEPAQLVLFCVKSYDTAAAAPELAALLAPDGQVLCLQNGVDNEEQLAEVIDPRRLLSGVLYIGARRTGPGAIACSAPARLHFGRYGRPAPAAELQPVAERLSAAGLDVTAEEDIAPTKWQKFVFNCGLNPLTALLQQPLGAVLAQPSGQRLYTQLVGEAIAAGRAHGAPLGPDAGDRAEATGRRMNILSSMAEDLAAGRRLEIGAFTGYVCALGRRHAVPTPVSEVVLDLLRTVNAS
jgi:2-dehydropantoate 2-reductase